MSSTFYSTIKNNSRSSGLLGWGSRGSWVTLRRVYNSWYLKFSSGNSVSNSSRFLIYQNLVWMLFLPWGYMEMISYNDGFPFLPHPSFSVNHIMFWLPNFWGSTTHVLVVYYTMTTSTTRTLLPWNYLPYFTILPLICWWQWVSNVTQLCLTKYFNCLNKYLYIWHDTFVFAMIFWYT